MWLIAAVARYISAVARYNLASTWNPDYAYRFRCGNRPSRAPARTARRRSDPAPRARGVGRAGGRRRT